MVGLPVTDHRAGDPGIPRSPADLRRTLGNEAHTREWLEAELARWEERRDVAVRMIEELRKEMGR